MKLAAILAACLIPLAAGAQGMININPGLNKRFINFDPFSTGDFVNFAFASTATLNTDGTYNDVMRWGWNLGDGSSSNARFNPLREAFFYAIEHKWLTNGRYWTEAHQYQITPTGASYRPDSSLYPHDGGPGSERAFNVGRVTFGTWGAAPTPSVAKFIFDTDQNRVSTTSGAIVGIGGGAQTGRSLKVYGNAEVTGPLIAGSYIQASYIVLATDLYAASVKVGGKKVVGQQCPRIPDATSAADVVLLFNDLLDCLRAHGLVAP